METKFINEYRVTLELFKEWTKNPIGRQAIKNREKSLAIHILGCVIGVILIVLGVSKSKYSTVMFGGVMFVVFLLRLVYIPNKVLRKKYEQIISSAANNQLVITATFLDNIIIEADRTTTKLEYSEVVQVTEDEDYFYLFVTVDMIMRICKDSFISGSPDEFRVFINAKTPEKAECIELEEEDLGL